MIKMTATPGIPFRTVTKDANCGGNPNRVARGITVRNNTNRDIINPINKGQNIPKCVL